MVDKMDIVPLNMNDIKEKISDQIKGSFAGLIPEEFWKSLVDNEIKDFKEKALPKLIRAELEKRAFEIIKNEFNKEEYNVIWDGMRQSASETVRSMLKELGPALVAELFAAPAHNIIFKIKDEMSRYGLQY